MEVFTKLDAVACPLPFEGIDTDQLAPARFLKRLRSEGYGPVLLHDLRQNPGFPLEQPPYKAARILVVRRNFGGGSSREAAVYALVDFGIRCVIAPSFGDIFSANAVGNGLLPAVVSEANAEAILAALHAGPPRLAVDLHQQRIFNATDAWPFTIDPVWREKLLNGWDDVDLTHSYREDIDAFVQNYREQFGWAWKTP